MQLIPTAEGMRIETAGWAIRVSPTDEVGRYTVGICYGYPWQAACEAARAIFGETARVQAGPDGWPAWILTSESCDGYRKDER